MDNRGGKKVYSRRVIHLYQQNRWEARRIGLGDGGSFRGGERHRWDQHLDSCGPHRLILASLEALQPSRPCQRVLRSLRPWYGLWYGLVAVKKVLVEESAVQWCPWNWAGLVRAYAGRGWSLVIQPCGFFWLEIDLIAASLIIRVGLGAEFLF